MIKLGLVDDKFKLLNSLKNNLELYDDIVISWAVTSGKDALVAAEEVRPDIILMDIEMPEMDGIATTAALKEMYSDLRVIMLTVFDDTDKIFQAILAGASGYLLKDTPPTRIYSAVKEAHEEGGAPMSPTIAIKTLQLVGSMQPIKPAEDRVLLENELSQREIEILQHITVGMTYTEIADKLFISPKTVRNHIQNIYKKLHVTSKTEAINLASKHKWF